MTDIPQAAGSTLPTVGLEILSGPDPGLRAPAYQVGLVLLGNSVAKRLKTLPFARKLATRLAGMALIGFGLKLAAGNR